jgi:hypothetical protein
MFSREGGIRDSVLEGVTFERVWGRAVGEGPREGRGPHFCRPLCLNMLAVAFPRNVMCAGVSGLASTDSFSL